MANKVEKMAKSTLNAQQREFIRSEVDLLIHNGDASESSLHRVAASLRVFADRPQAVAPPSRRSPSENGISIKKNDAKPSINAAASKATAVNESSTARRPPPSEVHAGDVWAHLSKRDAEEFAKEQLEHRKLLKRKEDEQRNFLEAQVQRRTEIKLRHEEDERAKAAIEMEQVRLWQIEELKKKDEVKKKLADDRQQRDEQLRLAKEKKAREEILRREDDERQAAAIREAIRKEEELNEVKRIRQKEEVAKFHAINKMHEDAKQRERDREAEMDKVHQKLYLERLAKDERERDQSLAKMHEKQRHQQTMATQMQASVAERAADDERKAKEYASKKEAQAAEEARKKAERQDQEKTKIKQYLAMQILEREQKQDEERDRQEKLRLQMKQDVEAAERAEHERLLLRKQKQDHQRVLLEQQMTERENQRPVYMTDEERRLNAKLIDKALAPKRR
ncbi:Hypothetical protein, putative [Bodo saltans]|uniref:Trichohyalin-plectin-homology domain-containing protein n=1 Tax=Bodo saltans TaxID=75058 RepID=A0A0S4JGX0_BODSA|nr:Hypothetical protein, putative [Bodo saltans]|eukprot:CUG88238.1 Hypothetical protein, putative [Bodo saltans]